MDSSTLRTMGAKCKVGFGSGLVGRCVRTHVDIKHLNLSGGGLADLKWSSVGAGLFYIKYLVPLGEGCLGPNGGRLASLCCIYSKYLMPLGEGWPGSNG